MNVPTWHRRLFKRDFFSVRFLFFNQSPTSENEKCSTHFSKSESPSVAYANDRKLFRRFLFFNFNQFKFTFIDFHWHSFYSTGEPIEVNELTIGIYATDYANALIHKRERYDSIFSINHCVATCHFRLQLYIFRIFYSFFFEFINFLRFSKIWLCIWHSLNDL